MASKSSLKDFEFLNKLGEGSYGTVFKVRRKGKEYVVDKKLYVMKQISLRQMDRRGQQEALNEVNILASLDNPYIVKYYDSFIENKVLNIVMEFCDKGDLSKILKVQMGRLLPESKIWKYFIQMCFGLEYIHSKKILHRDIKSMNVFLAKEDDVRIGDLGVAKVLSNTAAFAHTYVGTPYYLSPELCEDKPYNTKSDVWALGCVLYELCALRHPFDANNQGALFLKIVRGHYSPISNQFSPELREVVDLCLCKDYRRRPGVQAVLNRPGMKERALGLNIMIPNGSIIADTPVSMNKPVESVSPIYQSKMAIIEEEDKVNKVEKKDGKPQVKKSEPLVQKKIEPPMFPASPYVNNKPICKPLCR